MSIANHTKVTPQDLLIMPDSIQYELIDGELKERPVSLLSSMVGGRVFRRIDEFCEKEGAGAAWPADAGCQCFPDLPLTVRKPDVMFIRRDRLPEDWTHEAYLRVAPDLVVEVISPNELASHLETKISQYLSAGVRLVWVIDPVQRTVRIHRADGSIGWLRDSNMLSGENVLPGFSCAVRELFPTTGGAL
jgi:Uma2 family endonuclease